MILWRLRGYADPGGEWESGNAVCGIERSEDGYRLLVEQNGEILVHESHASIESARGKAEILREKLLKQGWAEPEAEREE